MIRTNEQAPALKLPLFNTKTNTSTDGDSDDHNASAWFDTKDLKQDSKMTIIVFFRGKHCPICINYLADIESKYDDILNSGMRIVAASMDDAERTSRTAQAVSNKLGNKVDSLRLPLAYGLTMEQAREWGLFLSSARDGSTEPSVFSEPGLFVLDSLSGKVFMASIQSAPFTRPDIGQLLDGLEYAVLNKYPARGTYHDDEKDE